MSDLLEEESGLGSNPEATLFEQAQAGCAESLNALMMRHERLVHLVVHRQWLCTLTYEEAAQAGRHGLWRAILGFDPQRGTAFAAYAYGAIMRYVWGAVKDELRRLQREVPMGVLVLYWYPVGPDPAWLREQREVERSLQALVKRLPRRLRWVIQNYYGCEGCLAHTFRALGVRLGVCGERIRQLHEEALVWLRQPAHSQELRQLLARHTQAQYELAEQLAQLRLRRRGGRYAHRFDP
jgi:RNA polymerase sigma factor (sigma-70 family)